MRYIKLFENYSADDIKNFLRKMIKWKVINQLEYFTLDYIDDNYELRYGVYVSDTGTLDYTDFFKLYQNDDGFDDDIDVLTLGKSYAEENGFIIEITIGAAPGYQKNDCGEVLENILDSIKRLHNIDVLTPDTIHSGTVWIRTI